MSTPTPLRAILTGASGGIGCAMAKQLAPLCSELTLLGRNATALAKLRQSLNAQAPTLQVHCLAGDLNDTEYQRTLADHAADTQANLLIFNAGTNHFGPIQQASAEQTKQILSTNLQSPILLTQALLPALLQRPQAQIVYVGSMLGYIGYPGNASYCASKFGLRGFAQALRRELFGTHVAVKYLAPRATDTAINTSAVMNMNAELGVKTDTPQSVAHQLLKLLHSNRFELKLGWPERLFALINQVLPALTDQGIAKQLPVIRKHWQPITMTNTQGQKS